MDEYYFLELVLSLCDHCDHSLHNVSYKKHLILQVI